MKIVFRFFGLLICLPILAGIYGILHDQITFTISHEYFTKFKFHQFRIYPEIFGSERICVAIIGFLATWWTGIPAGFMLALFSINNEIEKRFGFYMGRSVFILFFTALIFGIIGFLFGKIYYANHIPDWIFPDDLLDKTSFILVGSIHNFSYLGGLLGLIFTLIFLSVGIARSKKIKSF